MNAKADVPKRNDILMDIGAWLRFEQDAIAPASQSLLAIVKNLETPLHDSEGERLFAEVDAQVAEILRAAGRQPCIRTFPPEE